MAYELAKAYVSVIASTKGVGASIITDMAAAGDRAGAEAGAKASSGFGRLFGGTIGKVVAAGVAAIPVAGIFGTAFSKGFSRLKAIDVAQAKLRGLGHDADAVKTIMSNASAAVKGTAFGLDAAATTAAGAVAAGIAPGERLEKVLTSVANSAASSGSSMEEMGAIYNKVASLGKAQNDVLQQVADRGIPIYQALADQLGTTTEGVFKLASDGKINFEQFEKAMTKASGTVAKEMGNTLPGAFENAKAALGRFGANILGGVYPVLTKFFLKFQEWMKPVEEFGKIIGKVLGGAVDWLVQKAGQLAQQAAPVIQSAFDVMKNAAKSFATGFSEAMGAWGDSSLWGAMFSVLGEAIQGLAGKFQGHGGTIVSVAKDLGGILGTWLPPIAGSIVGIFTNIVRVAGELAGAVMSIIPHFQGLGDAAGGGLEGALATVHGILEKVSESLYTLSEFIGQHQEAVGILIGVLGGAKLAYEGVTTAIDLGKGALDVYKTGIDAVTGTVDAIKAVGEGFKLVKEGAGTAQDVAELGKAAELGAKAFEAQELALKGAAAAAAVYKAAMGGVVSGIKAVWGALSANPLGAIVTALALVAAGLVYFFTQTEVGRQAWDNLMKAIQPVIDTIVPILGELGRTIVEAFQPLVAQVVPKIQEFGKTAADVFGKLAQQMVPVFERILKGNAETGGGLIGALAKVADAVVPKVMAALETVGNMFQTLGPTFISFGERFGAAFMQIGDHLTPLIPMVVDFGVQLIQAFQPLIPVIVDQLLPAIMELVGTILGLFPQIAGIFLQLLPVLAPIVGMFIEIQSAVAQLAIQLITALMPVLTTVISVFAAILAAIIPLVVFIISSLIPVILSLVEALIPLITTIIDILVPIIKNVLDIVITVVNAIVPIIKAAIDIIINVIKLFTSILKGDWEGAWNAILGILKGIWDLIVSVIEGAIKIVWQVIASAIDIIKNVWNAAWDGIGKIVSTIWEGIKKGVSDGIHNVIGFFQKMGVDIVNELNSLPGKLVQMGTDIINGLVNGIKNAAGAVYQAVKSIADGLPGWMKGPLGIHSPSRVMRDEVGKWIPLGLAEGISKNSDAVADAITDMTDKAVDAAREGFAGVEDAIAPGLLSSRVDLSSSAYGAPPAALRGSASTARPAAYGQRSGFTVQVTGNDKMDPDRFGRRFGEAFAHEMEGILV